MRKRSSKTTNDPNVAAFRGMQSLLEILDPEATAEKPAKKAAETKKLKLAKARKASTSKATK